MNTLAHINDAVIAALAKEPRLPAAVVEKAEASFNVLAGLLVDNSQSVREERLAERKAQLDQYNHDREEFEYRLKQRALTALVFMPKMAWERICTEAGLYRLAPDAEGKVKVSTEPFYGTFDQSGLINIPFLFAFACVICTVSSCAYLFFPYIELIALFGFVSGSFAWLVGLGLGIGAISLIEAPLLLRRFRRYAQFSHSVHLQHFFPGGTSPEEAKMRIAIMLPDPSAAVAEILRKASNLSLQTAVIPEAVQFLDTIPCIYWDESSRRWGKERTKEEEYLAWREEHRRDYRAWIEGLRRQGINPDPIIYSEFGSVVAILVQVGKLPIENEVIDQVLNSEYLL